jgi:hypothetical protein
MERLSDIRPELFTPNIPRETFPFNGFDLSSSDPAIHIDIRSDPKIEVIGATPENGGSEAVPPFKKNASQSLAGEKPGNVEAEIRPGLH